MIIIIGSWVGQDKRLLGRSKSVLAIERISPNLFGHAELLQYFCEINFIYIGNDKTSVRWSLRLGLHLVIFSDTVTINQVCDS